jgi:hypothetical protein
MTNKQQTTHKRATAESEREMDGQMDRKIDVERGNEGPGYKREFRASLVAKFHRHLQPALVPSQQKIGGENNEDNNNIRSNDNATEQGRIIPFAVVKELIVRVVRLEAGLLLRRDKRGVSGGAMGGEAGELPLTFLGGLLLPFLDEGRCDVCSRSPRSDSISMSFSSHTKIGNDFGKSGAGRKKRSSPKGRRK